MSEAMLTVTLSRRDAPRQARRLVAEGCAEAATGPECADAAAVMTSEVVTNALLHGSGAITLGVLAGSRLVRVEVGDEASGAPLAGGADASAEGGRGLLIVEALSSGWGVRFLAVGKIVWFEVPSQP